MNWIQIESIQDIEQMMGHSKECPILVFKHSTRCPISSMALSRLEREKEIEGMPCYFLDLIKYRELSNHISDITEVKHESPQAIIVHNGNSIFSCSHAVTWGNIRSNT